jgi:hypothetical protein
MRISLSALALALAFTVPALAKPGKTRAPASSWLTCKPHKNAKDNGYGNLEIQITADELKYKGKDTSGKEGHGSAKRDKNWKNADSYRYEIDGEGDIFATDGSISFFANKSLTKGGTGSLGVSTQGICDGDACEHTMQWASEGTWSCGE